MPDVSSRFRGPWRGLQVKRPRSTRRGGTFRRLRELRNDLSVRVSAGGGLREMTPLDAVSYNESAR